MALGMLHGKPPSSSCGRYSVGRLKAWLSMWQKQKQEQGQGGRGGGAGEGHISGEQTRHQSDSSSMQTEGMQVCHSRTCGGWASCVWCCPAAAAGRYVCSGTCVVGHRLPSTDRAAGASPSLCPLSSPLPLLLPSAPSPPLCPFTSHLPPLLPQTHLFLTRGARFQVI